MPELPEVETTRRGIEGSIKDQLIDHIVIRNGRLRWLVDAELSTKFAQFKITEVQRRSKYLLLRAKSSEQIEKVGHERMPLERTLIIHLGMSGSLHVVVNHLETTVQPLKHDHIDIVFSNGTILRYRDPRRFGSVLWCEGDPLLHPLLKSLGPEPLSDFFEFNQFYQRSRSKKQTIKQFIMDASNVVGVGNIYASEALFMAKVRPANAAGRVTKKQFSALYQAIKIVLAKAIEKGGTTLKDFVAPSNQLENKSAQPGYFQQELMVYGRTGQDCYLCGDMIKEKKIAQRNSFYCPSCQH